MKRILNISCFLLVSFVLSAETVLNIHQKTGIIVGVSFAEKPILTYSGTVIIISTEKETIEYPVAELSKITFEETQTSTSSIYTSAKAYNKVYDIHGREVSVFDKGENVDLDNLPNGIYIVKTDCSTYKIIKR